MARIHSAASAHHACHSDRTGKSKPIDRECQDKRMSTFRKGCIWWFMLDCVVVVVVFSCVWFVSVLVALFLLRLSLLSHACFYCCLVLGRNLCWAWPKILFPVRAIHLKWDEWSALAIFRKDIRATRC